MAFNRVRKFPDGSSIGSTVMAGRNPPLLYCTVIIKLIAMQGHQNKQITSKLQIKSKSWSTSKFQVYLSKLTIISSKLD